MSIKGVTIETLASPALYSDAQIYRAGEIAQMLNRGKLVLVEEPQR
jgi:hypothetical protein